MRKVVQWIIIAALLLLAINVISEPANATTSYVEVSTFTQLKSALTNPGGATVKMTAHIIITRADTAYNEEGVVLGEGFYTLDLNGYTLKYEYVGLSGDPEGSPLVTRNTKVLTIHGPGEIIGGTYAVEQGSNWGQLVVEGGTLRGVIGSGLRMTGGVAYLRGGTITGNFYGVDHEDGIVVSEGSTIKSIVSRTMGHTRHNYGVIKDGIFTGDAFLDFFVLVIDDLTIAQGASMKVESRGGLVVKNTFQNLGTYQFNGGLESLGGVAVLKNQAQSIIDAPLILWSLKLEPQSMLTLQNQATVTVNGPYVNNNGGIIANEGFLVLNGSIEHSGHAEGVPQLEELQQAGGAFVPGVPATDTSKPADWALPEIEAARSNWLNQSPLLSFYQNNIRREEFAELVVKLYEALAGQEAPLPKVNPFSDIDLLHVQKAAELGIVSGRGAGIFDPFGLITRQEMATMYDRLLHALKIWPVVTQEYVLFSDEEFISEYAKSPLQLMYKIDIIKGEGTDKIIMAPLRNSSRETAIVISNRIFKKYAVID